MSKIIEKTSKSGENIKCEVFEEYGEPFGDGKWQYRLTQTSWGDREKRYDLRKWSPNMEQFSSGLRFTDSELYDLLNAIEEALGISE